MLNPSAYIISSHDLVYSKLDKTELMPSTPLPVMTIHRQHRERKKERKKKSSALTKNRLQI